MKTDKIAVIVFGILLAIEITAIIINRTDETGMITPSGDRPPVLEFNADPNCIIEIIDPDEIQWWYTENTAFDPNILWDSTLTVYDLSIPELYDICIEINGVKVVFKWDDGKFDVVYDANDLSGAADTFFTYMLPYLNEHIEAKARGLTKEKRAMYITSFTDDGLVGDIQSLFPIDPNALITVDEFMLNLFVEWKTLLNSVENL